MEKQCIFDIQNIQKDASFDFNKTITRLNKIL